MKGFFQRIKDSVKDAIEKADSWDLFRKKIISTVVDERG